MSENQNPEQKARDAIDAQLKQAGWVVQSAKKIDFSAGLGIAVREYQTDVGPADYVLFVDKKAVGVIEAKKEELGHRITEVEEQTVGYAAAKLKWVNNKDPLPALNPDRLPAHELRLRDCQEVAISNLEESFKANRPRALIQMATGAGKTYTAITSASLDIFWLKDQGLADLDNLPEPDELAGAIINNLEAGLESFRAIAAALP